MSIESPATLSHRVCDDLFVGPHPRGPADLTALPRELGVGAVLSLQDDRDLARLGLREPDLQAAARMQGMTYVRVGIRDFDEADMRRRLPEAVRTLARLAAGGAPVYTHCTAGVGRSALVAAGYVSWVYGREADRALAEVQQRRPGAAPSRRALLGAQADMGAEDSADAARALFPEPCG